MKIDMKRLFFVCLILLGLSAMTTAQDMPTVTIVTDGPIVNTPAVHGTITVDDHQGTVIQMHAGFKIRGTSSQQYDKKSYRVELWSDETGSEMADTTFLGLRSDDDWNLEALWAQPLRLRDKVANELWMEMYQLPYLENEPTALPGIRMEYVDLYVNDDFMGVYALTERMDRKQLGLRKYNGNIRGLLFKGNGAGAPTFDTLPGYDNALDTWDNYEWVYPNESDTVYDWSSLYNFTNFVMNASDIAFYSQYSTMFDADNAVDYFIFINVLKAMDNMGRNLFVARYKKTSTFFYAPWDLDAIWGLDLDGQQTVDAKGILSNGFFDRLMDDCSENGFANKTRDRYNALRETVLNREHIMELVRNQYQALVECGAYDHEHEAWPEYTVDESLLDAMSDWLDARFAYLDVELNAACGTWDIVEVEQEFAEVFPNPAQDRVNIRFAEPTDACIRMYDMTGRLVYASNTVDQAVTFSVKGLGGGIYVIVTTANGIQQVNRLFVK
jgi:hypothetical protein